MADKLTKCNIRVPAQRKLKKNKVYLKLEDRNQSKVRKSCKLFKGWIKLSNKKSKNGKNNINKYSKEELTDQ